MSDKNIKAYEEYVAWLGKQKHSSKSQPDVVRRLQLYARLHDTTVKDMLAVKRKVQPINKGFRRHIRWGPGAEL